MYDLALDQSYLTQSRTEHFRSIIDATSVRENWTPGQHFHILHRRENHARHPQAIIQINRYIGTKRHNYKVIYSNSAKAQVLGQTEAELDYLIDQEAVTINQNTFIKWRSEANFLAAGAIWLDIDEKDLTPMEQRDKHGFVAALLAKIETEGLPLPSFVMSSGRGFNFVWLHNYIYKNQKYSPIESWKILVKRMTQRVESWGYKCDASVKEISRVFRLAGTVNEKSGKTVRPIFVSGDFYNPQAYDFHDMLSDFVEDWSLENAPARDVKKTISLKPSSNVVRHSEFQAKRSVKKIGHRRSIKSWHSTLLYDIEKLIRIKYKHSIPTGMRDKYALIMGNTLAWLVDADAQDLELQMKQYHNFIMMYDQIASVCADDFTSDDVKRSLKSVHDRLLKAINKEKFEFLGQEVDPRYHYSRSKIVELLEVTDEDAQLCDLRCLISDDVKRQRDRERKATSRSQQSPARSADERADERYAKHMLILETYQKTKTIKGTAKYLSCSKNTVKSVLKKYQQIEMNLDNSEGGQLVPVYMLPNLKIA